VIDEFVELLRRQHEAVALLEARLRALELIVASDEHRFLGLALDEVESASRSLSGLELARTLVLSTAGIPVDATARGLVERFGGSVDVGADQPLPTVIAELREGTERLSEAKRRAEAIVRDRAATSRTRIDAAQAFASV